MEWLLNEWRERPVPRTPAEIAQWFLSAKFKREKGYLPYDRTQRYRVNDKILIRVNSILRPARITKVSPNCSTDRDGFSFDKIVIEFLDFQLGDGNSTKKYIANYHGVQYASTVVKERAAISREEQVTVESQILMAMSSDRRVVSVGNRYFPADFMVNLRAELLEAVQVIAKSKRPMKTIELLEALSVTYPAEQRDRWIFSGEFYLHKDERLHPHSGDGGSWDIRKPTIPLLIRYDRTTRSRGIPVSIDVENLLYYHGHTEECTFCLQGDQVVTGLYDRHNRELHGPELMDALDALFDNEVCELFVTDSEVRGGPVTLSSRAYAPVKCIHCTVTVTSDWLDKEVLMVPPQISVHLRGLQRVTLVSAQCIEAFRYDEAEGAIVSVGRLYHEHAVAEGDKVRISITTRKPDEIVIALTWRFPFNDLMQLPPEDFQWQDASVRDCIIIVLGQRKEPQHYREIYATVSRHKDTSLQSVVEVLSRYSPAIFAHVGKGMWKLAAEAIQSAEVSSFSVRMPELFLDAHDEVWEAVGVITRDDYVYRLLAKVGQPLTYAQIVEYLSQWLHVDGRRLAISGFLDIHDDRLTQLDDGSWALSAWAQMQSNVTSPILTADSPAEDSSGVSNDSLDSSARSRGTHPILLYCILAGMACLFAGLLYWLLRR